MMRCDLDLLPHRRVELAAPGAGFAASAQPVMATAVSTGVEGLEAGPVSIDSNGFPMPAYRAMPAGGEHLPIVLVISEIFGVQALKAPVLGLYGGAHTGIPLETVEAMKVALVAGSEAAKRSQFVVYPEAKHAFFADYRPSYDKPSAEDGWKRCLDWLRVHGVA